MLVRGDEIVQDLHLVFTPPSSLNWQSARRPFYFFDILRPKIDLDPNDE
jgi:hypothetical protein